MTFLSSIIDVANPAMWVTFAVIIFSIVLFANDRIPIELSSIAIIALLLVYFHLFPVRGAGGVNLLGAPELLQGFANPVLFAIMSLLVVGQGHCPHRGAGVAGRLVALRRHHPWLAIAVVLSTVLLISAFMNNTPVVVIFIPIITAVAEQYGAEHRHGR